MRRWSALLLSTLLLAGCSAGRPGGTTRQEPPPPPALQTDKPLPAYQPMRPLVEDAAQGYKFKRPTDWAKQLETPEATLFVFGSAPGVTSATFIFGRPVPQTITDKWKVPSPFQPVQVRESWLAQQKDDPLHRWAVKDERAAAAAGLSGYRFDLTGGSDKFRSDLVAYLLVGSDRVLVLTVAEDVPRPTFNPERWAGMVSGLDDLVPTLTSGA